MTLSLYRVRSPVMEVRGITWLGTRTERSEETVAFFRDVLGLRLAHQDPTMTALRMANGDTVEVFTAADRDHEYFTTGPVAGFQVEDVGAARDELVAAGVELIGELSSESGWSWQHFRAPDGNVYEVTGRSKEGA
jgi:catechol 2,3-dioxygenase-like lactoylglutathione lyase family enzyme